MIGLRRTLCVVPHAWALQQQPLPFCARWLRTRAPLSGIKTRHAHPEYQQPAQAFQQGEIFIRNRTRRLGVDKALLERDIRAAMELLGCPNWDVSVWLTTDKTVRGLNAKYRSVDKSTDVLSFPMHEFEEPGVLPVPEPEHEMELDLGEMMISLAYVSRQIERDRAEYETGSEMVRRDMESEPGVSGAMATCFSLQERLSLLCVHGLLHLLGYDHEMDEDYEQMLAKETEILAALHATEGERSR